MKWLPVVVGLAMAGLVVWVGLDLFREEHPWWGVLLVLLGLHVACGILNMARDIAADGAG